MRRSKRVLLSLLLCFSLLASLGIGVGPIPGGEEAKAAGSTFTDMDQNAIVDALGAGWNYGNQLEATNGDVPQEDYWSNVMMSENMMRSVARAGFKSIRIPVSWLSMIGSAPNYKLDSARLGRLKEVIDWALKYNLYVIMNIHGDGYSSVTGGWILPGKPEADQVVIKEKFGKVWGQLADYFKDYDQHLIFEGMNEVGADQAEMADGAAKDAAIENAYKNINDYNQIFVDTVRKTGGNNDKRWLLIPGMNTNIELTAGYDSENHVDKDYGFRLPTDTNLSSEVPAGQKRIMVSVHYYNPWAFCGNDGDKNTTQWGSDADVSKAVGYNGEDYMIDVFGVLKDRFTSKGYPVVLGEYGSIDKSHLDPKNPEFRKYYAYRLCTTAKENGIVPVYWDNAWNGEFGFALFDREAVKVTQQGVIDGIMSVYASNTKGTAKTITLDKKYVKMETNDDGFNLVATMTPDTAEDMISWSSSDSKVATVTYNGKVAPKGVGTCLITATAASGVSAYCIVEVIAPESLKLALYARSSSNWAIISGDNYCNITPDSGGGTYTISLTSNRDFMYKLNTLYLKDVTVERGIADESFVSSMTYKIDEVTLNGKKLDLIPDKAKATDWMKVMDIDPGTGKPGVPTVDLCFLNQWYDAADIFQYLNKNSADQYKCFSDDYYVTGDNTMTMKVTITNPVFEDRQVVEKTPVTSIKLGNESLLLGTGWTYKLSAAVEPANADEPVLWFSENAKVATVDQTGTITAAGKGTTTVHALTASGLDVTCPVEVQNNLTTPPPGDETPAPGTASPAPGTASPAPGTASPAPGTASPAPGTASPAPGTATPAPGTATPAPGTASPAPGTASPAPGVTASPGPGVVKPTVKPSQAPTKVTVKKVTLKKVKSTKKKTLLVQWKKLSGVTGYELQVSTDKKFKKGVKKYTVKKAKTTKKTIKKLKSKKKYYVRIRAYKTVNKKKYPGKWSSVKNAKVK